MILYKNAGLAAVTCFLLTLTACGEGSAFDEGFKKSFREKFVSSCSSGARQSVSGAVDVNFDKVCGCAADKIMEGKSATDLMAAGGASPEDFAKVQACLKELYPDSPISVGVGAK